MMKINLIKSQRVLSGTQIDLADFVINPYRGCEFGCIYCYSQENKNIKRRKEEWGEFVDIKIDSPSTLKKELIRIKPHNVILGTTTECFQPQEQKFKITKAILEILGEKDIPVVILTKSSLIEQYFKLINYNSANKIYFTLMFTNNRIKNLFEEKSIETIKKLIENGIRVKIHIGPFIPYLDCLEELFRLIPPGVKEVELEVYNSKMGNFPEILKIIKERISRQKGRIIEDDYYKFCRSLENEAGTINKKYKFKLNFIIPDYNCWYTDKIKYE